jgi:hypothetical protein
MFNLMQLFGGMGGGGMPNMNPDNPLSLALNRMQGSGKDVDPNQLAQQNLRQQLIQQMMNPQGGQAPTPGPSMGMPQPPMPSMPMGAPQGGMPRMGSQGMPMPGGAMAPQMQAPTTVGQLLAASMPGQGGMLQRKPFLGFGGF